MRGSGKKNNNNPNIKKGERSAARSQFTLQKRTSVKSHTVKPQFHKNVPVSNHDLLALCKYLKIPIKDVLSRDQTVPHIRQALFIYNLEPSYMRGSHWVATYVKDGIISYFDSFGMPPFQELVDHARKKNLTILHKTTRMQNINTTICGYFCLYFLNEMNRGQSYYDLLRACLRKNRPVISDPKINFPYILGY